VAVAAGVVAELKEGTADRGAGQAAAHTEELGLAGGALQPAGDQVDLVGQVAGRGAVERLRRGGQLEQALDPRLVVGADQADGGQLPPPDHGHLPPLAVGASQDDLLGPGQGGRPARLGHGTGERLQPVPGPGRLLVALLGRVAGHAPPQRAQHRLGVAVKGRLQGGDEGGVALLTDRPGAGAEAAAQLE
jgi:hypothetical protein